MQLTFESLAELQDFVQWIDARNVPIFLNNASLPPSPDVVQDMTIGDGESVEVDIDTPLPTDPKPLAETDKPARKRRTKAEMEAARAAENGSRETSAATAAAEQPATSDTTSAAVAESASIPAVAEGNAPRGKTEFDNDSRDAPDFIKSRLVERPEVSQVEHLNLARTFIGKHGMEKYNQSFLLAGLTPNVMGYSPADCATHAAALDFLSLE